MILINETILSDNFTELVKEDSTKETQFSSETSNLEIDDNNGKITGNILKYFNPKHTVNISVIIR